MTKEELRKKFWDEFEWLSVRAKHILETFKLDDFENFYNTLILKGKWIDFTKARNCGAKTEAELQQFVHDIKGALITNVNSEKPKAFDEHSEEGFSKRASTLFEQEFFRLTTKARTVLYGAEADTLAGYHRNIFQQKDEHLATLINQESKTYDELSDFKKTVARIIEQEIIDTDTPVTPPISINNNEVKAFNQKVRALFEEEFFLLTNKARTVLYGLDADTISGYYCNIIQHDDALLAVVNPESKTYKELSDFKKVIIEIIEKHQEAITTPEPQYTSQMSLSFQQEFQKLNKRTQNVLSAIGADNISGFNKNVLNEQSVEEILNFKKRVAKIIGQGIYAGLFSDLQQYLSDGQTFKEIEVEIIHHYLGIYHVEEIEKLEDIAARKDYSKERIRQISQAIPDKIGRIIDRIKRNERCDISKYFSGDYFFISQDISDKINQSEKTEFTPAFITFVLESFKHPEFRLIKAESKFSEYSGVFVKKSIPFHFQKCFDYLFQFVGKRREADVNLEIQELMKKFSHADNTTDLFLEIEQIDFFSQAQFVDVLRLFVEYVVDEEDQIEVSSDFIIFKRTTKKLIYEYLAEILDEYKKPMHFTELYEECKNQGIGVKSPAGVHGAFRNHPDVFGLKGPGIYGLVKWGGYFGKIGDVAEKVLRERNEPMDRKVLEELLARQLYISQDSIKEVMFNYENERRFIKLKNGKVALKEWYGEEQAQG